MMIVVFSFLSVISQFILCNWTTRVTMLMFNGTVLEDVSSTIRDLSQINGHLCVAGIEFGFFVGVMWGKTNTK